MDFKISKLIVLVQACVAPNNVFCLETRSGRWGFMLLHIGVLRMHDQVTKQLHSYQYRICLRTIPPTKPPESKKNPQITVLSPNASDLHAVSSTADSLAKNAV